MDKLMPPPALTSATTPPHYYSAELSWKLRLASSEKGSQDTQTVLTYSKQFPELNAPYEFSQLNLYSNWNCLVR